ncbi:MAG: HAMP domain-containing histidine kinase [Betaproteobacteria bacterium]|nr:HAMP domain-containing histidine kinase [Betaproteobacteria bacterium]
MAAALGIAAVGAGGAVWLQHRIAERDPDLALGPPQAMTADLAAATLRYGGVEALRDWMKQANARRPLGLLAVDSQGVDVIGRPVPARALERARSLSHSDGQLPRAIQVVAAPSGESYLLFAPYTGQRRYRPPEPSPWLWLAMGAVASLAVSALLAWYLSRPIEKLRAAFHSLAEGRLDIRVRGRIGRRRDEIADLGTDFDAMAERIEMLVGSQRKLLHDVSHELRSPLARLHAAAGLLRQNPANAVSLERIEREATRLDEMVGEILTLARLEARTGEEPLERMELCAVVASMVEDAAFEAEAAGRRIRFEGTPPAYALVRFELLEKALGNVIGNALKYTLPGTAVGVLVNAEPGSVKISVRDHGPGVLDEDRALIFQPFYRAKGTADVKGFGLGLAIAQAAIAACGGEISAINAAGGGLRVELRLPAA